MNTFMKRSPSIWKKEFPIKDRIDDILLEEGEHILHTSNGINYEDNGIYEVSIADHGAIDFECDNGDGGDIVFQAGPGRDGNIYLSTGGRGLSLSGLLDMIQSLGYGHIISDENDEIKEPKIHCDYDNAKRALDGK